MNGNGNGEVLPGKDGFSTAGLRSDPRQWLIYDEETQGALVRGLETMALQMVGQTLRRNKDMKVRAIGNVMLNVADARLRDAAREPGSIRDTVIKHLARIMGWLSGRASYPAIQLDEVHAALYQLDHRMRSAGISGPGHIRDLARGD
jgi:hypothetical protein